VCDQDDESGVPESAEDACCVMQWSEDCHRVVARPGDDAADDERDRESSEDRDREAEQSRRTEQGEVLGRAFEDPAAARPQADQERRDEADPAEAGDERLHDQPIGELPEEGCREHRRIRTFGGAGEGVAAG
jgi:hypothetical protein